jgi:hypothetical protein
VPAARDGNPVLPNDCSLRGAVRAANANRQTDIITLPDGLYRLTLAGANEDFALTGDLDVRGPLTLQAAPGAHPVIEQTVGDRIFHSSVLFFTGSFGLLGPMTLAGGTAVASSGLQLGGSIYVFRSGSLTLTDVTLTGGSAPDDGGCLYFANPAAAGALTLSHRAHRRLRGRRQRRRHVRADRRHHRQPEPGHDRGQPGRKLGRRPAPLRRHRAGGGGRPRVDPPRQHRR